MCPSKNQRKPVKTEERNKNEKERKQRKPNKKYNEKGEKAENQKKKKMKNRRQPCKTVEKKKTASPVECRPEARRNSASQRTYIALAQLDCELPFFRQDCELAFFFQVSFGRTILGHPSLRFFSSSSEYPLLNVLNLY